MFQTSQGYGLDYGCGSAPIGFELAMRGNKMDFIDVNGAYCYEFLKWRAKKRLQSGNIGWQLRGDYDFMLFMDSIEHFSNWEEILGQCLTRLKPNGIFITNYFGLNASDPNVEHINMEQQAVWDFLIRNGVYPMNQIVWMKQHLFKEEEKNEQESTNTEQNDQV